MGWNTKTFFLSTILLSANLAHASRTEYTGRVEIRYMTTASGMCGPVSPCTNQNNVGFGLGVTTISPWTDEWGLESGILLRQREASINIPGSAPGAGNYLASQVDLDIPLDARWDFSQKLAVFAGLDIAIKIFASDSVPGGTGPVSQHWTDNSYFLPFELGLAWKFNQNENINFIYELGTSFAQGLSGNGSGATASTLSFGYGYTY